MKKILYFLALLLGVFAMVSLTSCDSHRHKSDGVKPDSTTVAVLADAVFNSEYTDAPAFVDYAYNEVRYDQFVETCKTLDVHTISFIADEVLKNHTRLTWDSWLDEFINHKKTYLQLDKANRLSFDGRFDKYKDIETPAREEDTVCVH